mgnify:CR=1 FL=1
MPVALTAAQTRFLRGQAHDLKAMLQVGGKGITDVPGGLKLQCEGHDVRYRNAWIKELDLVRPNTDFKN